MGTYYKHKKTETIDVPYSFKCEQCMKDSGKLTAVIKGMEAEVNSNYRELEYNKQQQLNEMAHKNLVREVKDSYKNATEKNIFNTAFKDECPHCHKPQSWAVSGIKNKLFENSIVSLIVGLIVAAGCYFFSGVDNALQIAIGAFGISVVAAIVFFLVSFSKMSSKKKQTANVTQRNVPVIEWGAVQNLLDEK
ncbi:MAG: hypothetical protein HFI10_14775 [Lachnospiraceae bacterium]|nr:hypothetical protein [Lachnospiraceae bacterium]